MKEQTEVNKKMCMVKLPDSEGVKCGRVKSGASE
jgi:hypothetical protein